jgi:hypothetical protein
VPGLRSGGAVKQRDLFGGRPSRVPGAAQQTPAKQHPYVVEPFNFDGSDPRLVPIPDVPIPAEIRIPLIDDEAGQ